MRWRDSSSLLPWLELSEPWWGTWAQPKCRGGWEVWRTLGASTVSVLSWNQWVWSSSRGPAVLIQWTGHPRKEFNQFLKCENVSRRIFLEPYLFPNKKLWYFLSFRRHLRNILFSKINFFLVSTSDFPLNLCVMSEGVLWTEERRNKDYPTVKIETCSPLLR